MPTSEIKNWVLNLAGRKVSMTAPTAGQFLKWNASLQTWEPQDIGTFAHTIISDWDTAVDGRIALQKGAANGVASLGPDGKIPSAQIPALAITRVEVVNSESAQLALADMEIGDVVVRTDISKTFIHNGGTSGTMADYTELLSPPPPVISVNGQTGAVVLTSDNIAEGTNNLYFTNTRVQGVNVGGDLSGTVGNATVVKIQNISVSPSAPSNGQVLVYNAATQTWEPGTPTATPSAHTHPISEITGLQAALDAKLDITDFNSEMSRMIRFESFEINAGAQAFEAASNTVDVTLLNLPVNAKVVGVSIRHSVPFAGTGISSVSVSIGASDNSIVDPDFYSMPYDVSQAQSPTTFHDAIMFLSKTSESHDVIARFTADGNFGTGSDTNLTDGSVTISIGYVVMPAAGPQ